MNIRFAREGLTEAGSKREESQARPTSIMRRTVARKIAKELELQARRSAARRGEVYSSEQICLELERVRAEKKEMNNTEQCHETELAIS